MPRFAKQATSSSNAPAGALDELVREAKAEGGKASDVARATRLTYEANAKQLAEGWDLESAKKGTRYAMRAAGQFVMRRQLRALIREAAKLRKDGKTGKELLPVREAMFTQKVEHEIRPLLNRLRAFQALPWSAAPTDPGLRLQASHKQRPATDIELKAFYSAASKSVYRVPFLIAEFTGCRGEEFREGVRVEAVKKQGVHTLQFFVQSAKCDQKKKGLDLRQIDVPFPSTAAKDVQRRWLELANVVAAEKTYVCKIAPTEKKTAGQLFTGACQDVSKAAKVHVAAYSLRNRFSAQTKQANEGDAVAVALALGHQTTETQRHYSRAKRGGGGVSPVASIGINVSGQTIRGPAVRSGPPLHHRERVALGKTTPTAARRASKPRGPRL